MHAEVTPILNLSHSLFCFSLRESCHNMIYFGIKSIVCMAKKHFQEKLGLKKILVFKHRYLETFLHGCGSGSGSHLDPDSIGSVDPDLDPGGQK